MVFVKIPIKNAKTSWKNKLERLNTNIKKTLMKSKGLSITIIRIRKLNQVPILQILFTNNMLNNK